MEVLILVMIQCVALLAVIELIVGCMPAALRRASEQNCYRVDGSRSVHRAYRERRARNRLRRDMLAVLILVFLTGNALYFTLDRSMPSDGSLLTRTWNSLVGTSESASIAIHRDELMAKDQKDKLVTKEQFERYWPWLMVAIGGWTMVCFLFVGWGALHAYKSFGEGVSARSAEHFHLDMTRMSITDVQLVNELTRKNDPSKGVA